MEKKARRPVRSRRRMLLWVAAIVGATFVASAFIAAKATESNRFCGQDCHEMVPYARTWETSPHDKVDCVRCHIPPGAWNFAKTKLFALRELWVHFTGQVRAPIAVTRHIPDVVCVDCHPADQTNAPAKLVTASFSHPGHDKVPLCIDCHAQLVHHAIGNVPYVPPRSMMGCFSCHDGKQQPNGCDYCHTAPHPDRGACEDCHSLQSWGPKGFHHPVALTGKHAQILCEQCHTSGVGTSIGPADGCVNCHGNHHQDPKMTLCADCHTTTHFVPSTFAHKQVGPHVPRGDEPLPCTACHLQTFATATCSCHGGTPPTGGS